MAEPLKNRKTTSLSGTNHSDDSDQEDQMVPFMISDHDDEEKNIKIAMHKEEKKQRQWSPFTCLMLTAIIVSLIWHKMAHVIYDAKSPFHNFGQHPQVIFYLPWVFSCDLLFLMFPLILLKRSDEVIQKKLESATSTKDILKAYVNFSTFLCLAMAIGTPIIAVAETKALMVNKDSVPFDMTRYALSQWYNFRGMAKSVSKSGKVNMNTLLWLEIAMIGIMFKPIQYLVHSPCFSLNFVHNSFGMEKTSSQVQKQSRIKLAIVCLVLMLSWSCRPRSRMKRLLHTPIVAAALDIIYDYESDSLWDVPTTAASFKQHYEFNIGNKKAKKNKDDATPLNVVVVLLESMRGDMMPFDDSTEWARRHIPDAIGTNLRQRITPYYAELVEKPNMLFIPHIKSAAGFTHKSLPNVFCSLHAVPMKLTREHESKFFHKCLPQILNSTGYGYNKWRHYKSMTSTFHYQTELMANIGYSNVEARANDNFEELQFYGELEFREDHPDWTDEEFEKHRANYFGFADFIFLDPLEKWIDQRLERKEGPFVLSYLSGVTHDPYPYPPDVEWVPKTFVENDRINGYLNSVSYTDEFLSKFMKMFRDKKLMDSTLFVFTGDHGVNILNRDEKFSTLREMHEESFDVGMGFYSENKVVAKKLAELKKKKEIHEARWTNLDIVPTILDLLGVLEGKVENTMQALNGAYDNSLVDGRSMLHPIEKRLSFSISNPGDRVILRDGDYAIIHPANKGVRDAETEIFNLKLDPYQESPLYLYDKKTDENKELLHWAQQAVKFITKVNTELIASHRTGVRCIDCDYSQLLSLETLTDWDEYEEEL